jgi:hypothetical protein
MYSFFFKELIFVFKQKICILDLLVSESRRLSHFCHTFILKSKYLMMNSLIGSF